MSRQRIQQIRERLALAAPGPWHEDVQQGPWVFVRDERRWECAHAMHHGGHNNGPLVANAPADLAWLCDELETAWAELGRGDA